MRLGLKVLSCSPGSIADPVQPRAISLAVHQAPTHGTCGAGGRLACGVLGAARACAARGLRGPAERGSARGWAQRGPRSWRWAANAAFLPSLPLDHGTLWLLLKCGSLRECKHRLGNELLNDCCLEVCVEHVLLILAVTTGGSWAGDLAGAATGLS